MVVRLLGDGINKLGAVRDHASVIGKTPLLETVTRPATVAVIKAPSIRAVLSPAVRVLAAWDVCVVWSGLLGPSHSHQ